MLSNEDKVDLGPFLKQFVMRNPFESEEMKRQASKSVTDLSDNQESNDPLHTKYYQDEHLHRQSGPLNFSSKRSQRDSEQLSSQLSVRIKVEKEDGKYAHACDHQMNFDVESRSLFAAFKDCTKDRQLRSTRGKRDGRMRRDGKGREDGSTERKSAYLVGRLLLARAKSFKLQCLLKQQVHRLSRVKCKYAVLKQQMCSLHHTFQQISKELTTHEC